MATAISDEARAKYNDWQRRGIRQIYTGLTFWTPNINIFRDPRWGRGQETYGEDPYLTGRMGLALVRGLQGDDARYLKAAACAKHYAVHSGPEPDRHGFDAVVDERDLRETYLPAFETLVREGHGRIGDGRVQPHQRRGVLRQPHPAGEDPAPGVGLRRPRRLRLRRD